MVSSSTDPVSTVLNWTGRFVGGFGRRLLVHLCSLVAAAIVGASLSPELGSMVTGTVVFLSYIGLICLVPRGRMQSLNWLIPTLAGVLQSLIWTVWGVPWQFTVLPAGLLTWMLRALDRKGDMGWEWAVLPWLLIGVYFFIGELAPLTRASVPYWTFPVLLAAGWGILQVNKRVRFDAIHRDVLQDAATRIAALTAKDALPETLRAPGRRLAEQGQRFAAIAPRFDQRVAAMVLDYDKLASSMARLSTRLHPETHNQELDAILAKVGTLNADLERRLKALQPPEPTDAARNMLERKIAEFTASADELGRKQYLLPEDLRPHIANIQLSTTKIVNCMRDDPYDVPIAEKFLNRYLPATHTLVDEHLRLSGQGAIANPGLVGALERSKDMLARLDDAFRDEHASLLANDTMSYTADLNVLDKLLKMDGR